MAVNFGLWRVDGAVPERMTPVTIDSEDRLELIIEQSLDVLGLGNLLLVGRQVITEFGKRIDMLALDDQGNVVVIELKRGMTPREVVSQTLEYGFWVRNLSFEAIRDLYSKHNDGQAFETAFTNRFELDVPESLNEEHQLVIVASGLDASTEQIVDYVRNYGVPINVLFFQYLVDGERNYLARSWMSDPTVEPPLASSTRKKQASWNGTDFYVAVGESEHRDWDDMLVYGFVSAGHGDKYRGAMAKLFVGARVWAHLTGSGYVGVGTVVAESVPVTEFKVEVDEIWMPILDAPLSATNIGEDKDDPSLVEYLVAIDWIDARPRSEAFWEKGMFANQNVVAKLRQPFTLSRLLGVFDLDGDE